jgi:hypothetical protein
LFVDELESQLLNVWTDNIQLYLPYRNIWDENDPYQILGDFLSDNRRGGRWWEREWYYSLPPEKGGARPLTVYNQDHVTLDLGLFQMNSKFKVKAKEFSFLLHRESRFTDGLGPPDYFKLRVRPSVTFGPPYGVRRGGLSLVLEWYLSRKKTWEFECYAVCRGDLSAQLGVQASLLRW